MAYPYFIRQLLWRIPLLGPLRRALYKRDWRSLRREVFGITFPHPVGLGAGIDRSGDCYNPLSDYGFSFVEIGFSKGVRPAIAHLQRDTPRTIIAANIEKRTSGSRDEDVLKEYTTAFSLLYDFVDFFMIDISRKGSEDLEDIDALSDILDELLSLRLCYEQYTPIVLKVSHRIEADQLGPILDYCMLSGIDGIATTSLACVRYIHEYTRGRLPIIGSGGIRTPAKAEEMLAAGASLIEIYSGFTHRGPSAVKRILRALDARNQQSQ